MYSSFEVLQSKCKTYYLKKTLKKIFYLVLFFTVLVSVYYFFDVKIQSETSSLEKQIQVVPPVSIPSEETPQEVKVHKDIKYDLKFYNYKLPEKEKKEKKPLEVKMAKKVEEVQKNFLITTKEMSSLESMLRSFEKENKYSIAIKIANHYYEKQDFVNSLAWSKQANKLNLKDDQSWIMYAKSEYAQGNKQRAIDLLQVYLKSASSKDALQLLELWAKGE